MRGLSGRGVTARCAGARGADRAELFISEKTASVHVSNILAEFGASGRIEAVALAAARGLLS